jgi:hypothetical protein
MLAITLGQAKAVALIVVVALIVAAVASAMLAKAFAQKAALVVILGLLALLVWTQRASLDDCADQVRANGPGGDTTCAFFGRDIEIST